MKKILLTGAIAGVMLFSACGPSAEELAAQEQARLDSIAQVEEAARLAEEMENQRIADSIALAQEEADRLQAEADAAAAAAVKPKATSTKKTTTTATEPVKEEKTGFKKSSDKSTEDGGGFKKSSDKSTEDSGGKKSFKGSADKQN
jgi:hypothetical protein